MTPIEHLVLQGTDTCNYRCPYCTEFGGILTHRKGGEMTKDGLGVTLHISGIWERLSAEHTKLILTGGEFSVARQATEIAEMFTGKVAELEIGSNCALPKKVAKVVEAVGAPKVHLGASFHPHHTDVRTFLSKLDTLLELLPDHATYDVQLVCFPDYMSVPGRFEEMYATLVRAVGAERVYLIPFFGEMHGTKYPNPEYNRSIAHLPVQPPAHGVPSKGRKCWAGAKSAWITSTYEVLRCSMVQTPIKKMFDAPKACPIDCCTCEDYHSLII